MNGVHALTKYIQPLVLGGATLPSSTTWVNVKCMHGRSKCYAHALVKT